MNKLFAIDVRGKQKEWSFHFVGDDRYLGEWLADGLKVSEVVGTIPKYWVDLGLPLRLWLVWQRFRDWIEVLVIILLIVLVLTK